MHYCLQPTQDDHSKSIDAYLHQCAKKIRSASALSTVKFVIIKKDNGYHVHTKASFYLEASAHFSNAANNDTVIYGFNDAQYFAFRGKFGTELEEIEIDESTRTIRTQAKTLFFETVIDQVMLELHSEKLKPEDPNPASHLPDAAVMAQAKHLLRTLLDNFIQEFESQYQTTERVDEKERAFDAFLRTKLAIKQEELRTQLQSLKHHNRFLSLLGFLAPAPDGNAAAAEEELENVKLALLHHFFKSLSPDFDVTDHDIAKILGATSALWLTLNAPAHLAINTLARSGETLASTATVALHLGIAGALSLIFIPVIGLITEGLYERAALKAFRKKEQRDPTITEYAHITREAKHLRNRMMGAAFGWSILFALFQTLKTLHLFVPQNILMHLSIAAAVGFGAGLGACLANWHKEKRHVDWHNRDKMSFYRQQLVLFASTFLTAVTWYALTLLAVPLGETMGKSIAQLTNHSQLSSIVQHLLNGLASMLLNIASVFIIHRIFKIGFLIANKVTSLVDKQWHHGEQNQAGDRLCPARIIGFFKTPPLSSKTPLSPPAKRQPGPFLRPATNLLVDEHHYSTRNISLAA